MIKPGGTAKPARVSRARFIPLPPVFSRVAWEEVKGRIVIGLLLHKSRGIPPTDSQKNLLESFSKCNIQSTGTISALRNGRRVELCILIQIVSSLRRSWQRSAAAWYGSAPGFQETPAQP